MAKTGDYYVIELKKSHLEWGVHRYSGTRGDVLGEGYLPIPKDVAVNFGIVNSNGTKGEDVLGKNIFYCTSSDGTFSGYLRAQGCSTAGDIYAKQFAGDKGLKALGAWFSHVRAEVGDQIRLEWISPNDIVISKMSRSNRDQFSVRAVSTGSIVKRPSPPKVPCNSKKMEIKRGDKVIHKKLGCGKVKKLYPKKIDVQFGNDIKTFFYPDAFDEGFLTLVNE